MMTFSAKFRSSIPFLLFDTIPTPNTVEADDVSGVMVDEGSKKDIMDENQNEDNEDYFDQLLEKIGF